jgi:exportin-2 (importin alpha re-exporter)
MQTILKVCHVAQGDVAPFVVVILQKLTAILMKVVENSRNPRFNHFVFETIVCLIGNVVAVNSSSIDDFEKLLFPSLQEMLSQEAALFEFGPYVFQVLAQMLSLRPDISPVYQSLFPVLLSPSYWEQQGNIHGLVELLRVYLKKEGMALSLSDALLTNLLGVFQKLIASSVNDSYGFELLMSIVYYIPFEKLAPYFTEVLKLLFSRAQGSMTPKFGKYFAIFLCFFVHARGVDTLYNSMEALQPGIFAMVLEKLWVPHIAKGASHMKIVSSGITELLLQSPVLQAATARNSAAILRILICWKETEQLRIKILRNSANNRILQCLQQDSICKTQCFLRNIR